MCSVRCFSFLNFDVKNSTRGAGSYDIRIFAFSPLVVNLSSKSHSKLRVALEKVLCLSWSNG